MKRFLVICLAVGLLLSLALIDVAQAAAVNIPLGAKTKDLFGISLGANGDWLNERMLSKYDAKLKSDIYQGELTLTLASKIIDLYLDGGVANKTEVKGNITNSEVTYKYQTGFIGCAGVSLLILDLEKSGFKVFADAKYRAAFKTKMDKVVIDGTEVDVSSLPSYASYLDWREWQAALGIAWKIGPFMPYGGVKYSDVSLRSSVTYNGKPYDMGDALKSKNKVGPFVGISIIPFRALSIDIEGRFIDEQAVSGKLTLAF